ncbi:MAG: hypothetical protein ACYC3P_12510 [Bellilinea sp.]
MTEQRENVAENPAHPATLTREKQPVRLNAQPDKLCPQCNQGMMDYDGLLNLTCPKCAYTQGGCFT